MCFPKSSCSIAFNLSKNITVCDTLYAKFELSRLIGVKKQNGIVRGTETSTTRVHLNGNRRGTYAVKYGQIMRGLRRKDIIFQSTTHSFIAPNASLLCRGSGGRGGGGRLRDEPEERLRRRLVEILYCLCLSCKAINKELKKFFYHSLDQFTSSPSSDFARWI